MKIPKLEKDELIAVIWDDAFMDVMWFNEEDAKKINIEECKTVGFFLNFDKRTFRLSQNWSRGNDGKITRDIMCIPINCIKRIVRIKYDSISR